jgi:hypothetical protein
LAALLRVEPREHDAILNADRKLKALGRQLGFPHSSAVVGTRSPALRELRPRRGRSRWRVLYATDPTTTLLAIAPEARRDPRGFEAATRRATVRHHDLHRRSQD